MEAYIFLVIGLVVGAVIAWLLTKNKFSSTLQGQKDEAVQKYNSLEKDFAVAKTEFESQINTLKTDLEKKEKEFYDLQLKNQEVEQKLTDTSGNFATVSANLEAANKTIEEKKGDVESLKKELKEVKDEYGDATKELAKEKANNSSLNEKLDIQKKEMEELGKKFNTEFENIANRILEIKSEKFTELNKAQLKSILEPLGKNIDDFKKQVDDVYKSESKERFSLGEKVKELAMLNQQISEEARNLTKALKGEAKTQGRWGEMILESILEKSGLVKDREYFMEHELKDEEGNPIRSESEGKKMRPDAVIKYPDNRSVIIDSKVSLNAFTRFIESTNADEQKRELEAHIAAVKTHIIALSNKGYDDYNKALDFVMMFIPSEPAYAAVLQGAPDIWNFAYDKRILLLSPTNLITSLKLIVDLWKREYQNQNAIEIAERGGKLYDKFVGFIDNIEGVGENLKRAQQKYDDAYKQLSTGNDNLVLQATKLKSLGVKTKKELSTGLENVSLGYELNE